MGLACLSEMESQSASCSHQAFSCFAWSNGFHGHLKSFYDFELYVCLMSWRCKGFGFILTEFTNPGKHTKPRPQVQSVGFDSCSSLTTTSVTDGKIVGTAAVLALL